MAEEEDWPRTREEEEEGPAPDEASSMEKRMWRPEVAAVEEGTAADDWARTMGADRTGLGRDMGRDDVGGTEVCRRGEWRARMGLRGGELGMTVEADERPRECMAGGAAA